MKDVKQVIVVRADLQMRKGKIAAQVAHASMSFLLGNFSKDGRMVTYLTKPQQDWLSESHAKIVARVESEQELLDLIAKGRAASIDVRKIIDAGRTEFHSIPTLTCAAFGPDYCDVLDAITGHLKLL